MSLFNIVREQEISREEEIRILYKKHNVSIEKLAEDLLYDREWCQAEGITYFNLKSPYPDISAWQIARNFVLNAVENEQE